MPEEFDPKLSLILDECIVQIEDGDESYRDIKATIEQVVLDDRHASSQDTDRPDSANRS